MKTKYHRTFHFPWSLSVTADDKVLSVAHVDKYFASMQDAYVTEKRDGENTTIGKGYSHARSLDSKDHWSRHHIKQLAARLENDIPEGWRICGENLLAKHSIQYDELTSFFEVFSIWNEKNERLPLDEMLLYCEILNLDFVPILDRGPFSKFQTDPKCIKSHFGLDLLTAEGYVIANAQKYHYDDASKNIAKFVRASHVTTDKHWMQGPQIKNALRQSEKNVPE